MPLTLIAPPLPAFKVSERALALEPEMLLAKLMLAPTLLLAVLSKLTSLPKVSASP